jgi:hypothetical protein
MIACGEWLDWAGIQLYERLPQILHENKALQYMYWLCCLMVAVAGVRKACALGAVRSWKGEKA